MLDNDEPATYAVVMADPDSESWQDAMKSEIEYMKENQVWNMIDPPDGVRTIECKCIYKKKKDMDGNVHIYKPYTVMHQVSCNNEMIPNAPKHYEMHQNKSLRSSGVDRVSSLRKIPT